ncbi:ABC transporter ATP-binding protein [Nocardia higoensis]|uniref:ABC transporter ATP-binding protein n=1 Tax=Nocardia higoensis TaxID=228599 RepID=UPI0002E98C72|nr:ABC transporter ATP-binding protein [Nocardia higoensis]
MTGALTVRGLVRRFGGVVALDEVDLTVEAGQTRALIGPNGSGKSTMINCISGVDRPDAGRIELDGAEVTGCDSTTLSRRGIARTFQTLRLFDDMTVLENVMVAMHHTRGFGLLSAIALTGGYRRAEAGMRNRAHELLELVGVADDAGRVAGTLPYGHRRLVEIARAMALDPTLLLLDEPAAGMNESETIRLAGIVQQIGATGLSMVVVEHNMDFIASVASQVTVLDNGHVIAEGTPREVREHPQVLEAYLGTSEEV